MEHNHAMTDTKESHMRKATNTTLVAATTLAAVLALAGCTTATEPSSSPTSSASPTPTATADPTPSPTTSAGLPSQVGPSNADDTLNQATKLIEEFLPVNLKISTEAAPATSVAAYIVPGSPAESRIADTVRLNAENKAALVGDGQFRWMTYYQTSYAAPLEDFATGEIMEFGSAILQGCLYNEGLTWEMNGQPTDVSTAPTLRQYTVIYDIADSRWKIQNIENLPDGSFPC